MSLVKHAPPPSPLHDNPFSVAEESKMERKDERRGDGKKERGGG